MPASYGGRWRWWNWACCEQVSLKINLYVWSVEGFHAHLDPCQYSSIVQAPRGQSHLGLRGNVNVEYVGQLGYREPVRLDTGISRAPIGAGGPVRVPVSINHFYPYLCVKPAVERAGTGVVEADVDVAVAMARAELLADNVD